MQNSFGEPLWGIGLKNRSLEAAALKQQLWGAVFGSNFGVQLSGIALQNGFGEPFWRTEAASGSSFGVWSLAELLWDAAFGSISEEQLWGATVGSNFAALQQH